MEGFQAKQNTSIERKANESPFEIRQEIREADSRGLGQFFYSQISVLNIFSSPLIQNNDILWSSQECDAPPAFQVK